MAKLPSHPKGHELEQFVAAIFQYTGFYIDKNVSHWLEGTTIGELDVVLTGYTPSTLSQQLIEVKSGHWTFGDLFRLRGWMDFVGLSSALFFTLSPASPGSKAEIYMAIASRLGIKIAYCPTPTLDDTMTKLKECGEDVRIEGVACAIWRWVYQIEEKFIDITRDKARSGKSPAAVKAKAYYQVINDQVFFVQDVRRRALALYNAHFHEQHLALEAAAEIDPSEGGSRALNLALRRHKNLPVQACLYVQHRGRLATLKAVVDRIVVGGADEHDIVDMVLPKSYQTALTTLRSHSHVHLYPLFWQVFSWAWGGFILKPRQPEEYEELAVQTGVPVSEIDNALSAFGILFGSTFEPSTILDDIRIIKLLPSSMRGLGAFHRMCRADDKDYHSFIDSNTIASVLTSWHNAAAGLIDGKPT
jgi:hypothetical protein